MEHEDETVDTAKSTAFSRFVDSILASKTASHILTICIVALITLAVVGVGLLTTLPFAPAPASPHAGFAPVGGLLS